VAFKVVRPEVDAAVPSGPTELTAPDPGTQSSQAFVHRTPEGVRPPMPSWDSALQSSLPVRSGARL
jgi:hypothetical protein